MRRFLLLACLSPCCLLAQLQLFVVQGNSEGPITDQYGFGTVSAGDHRNILFRLRNMGNSPTALTILTLDGDGFSLVNPPALPQSVAAGSAVDLMVSFAPAQPGFFSANFTADGASAIFYGTAISAATISLDNGTGTLVPLNADAVIDFGSIVRGATATRRLVLTNPLTQQISIRNVAVIGAAYRLKTGTLPIVLAPGASASIEVDFAPTINGKQPGALDIEQRQFKFTGVAVDPAFPQPQVTIDIVHAASSEQGKLAVHLTSASQATGAGEVDIDVNPSHGITNGDSGIQFLSTGTRTADFTVKQGDTVGHFGSSDSVTFQTGTTAGDLVFTVKLGDFTGQKTLTVPPAVVEFDSSQAQRTSAGLDLRINASDNARSAAKMTFTFFDGNGTTLPPGAITVDSSEAFRQFFASSDLGGVFSLHAFFPVIGNPTQVDAVEIQMKNSAGTAQTGRLKFTTP